MLKNGNLYINGDVLIDANRDFNYLDDWTKTFISNLYKINPIMTSVSTVLNDGIGRIVAETYIDVPRRNINIYGDNENYILVLFMLMFLQEMVYEILLLSILILLLKL